MSKHTNKYYQLIKILRNEKQMMTMNKTRMQTRNKTKTDRSNTVVNEETISNIIDKDNSLQLDEEDNKKTKVQSKLVLEEEDHSRLWLDFKERSLTLNQGAKLLPIQVKLNQNKDQVVIEQILEKVDLEREANESKIKKLSGMLNSLWEIINQNKRDVDLHQLEINQSQKELVNLKLDFDNEEKKTRERSNRFREEKSKDMMIKNINREDNHMRNAMMSRIKLNQQLDFSFQLQRRKAFNQAKSVINQKKKMAQEKYQKAKGIYEDNIKKSEQLEKQKKQVTESNKILKKESVCFLKNLIKNFPSHSKGVQWIVSRLAEMKVTLKKSDFPDKLTCQDKQFLEQLFRENISPQRQRFNRTCIKKFGDNTVLNSSIEHSRFKMISLKTEPDAPIRNEFENFMDMPPSPKRRLFKKNTVYFDADSHQESWFKENDKEEQTSKFYIKSNSLRKIYEHTGRVISDKIKKRDWNYESCKIMSNSHFPNTSFDNSEKGKIKEKLKLKFMNVRQNLRRNQLSNFIFGEHSQKT